MKKNLITVGVLVFVVSFFLTIKVPDVEANCGHQCGGNDTCCYDDDCVSHNCVNSPDPPGCYCGPAPTNTPIIPGATNTPIPSPTNVPTITPIPPTPLCGSPPGYVEPAGFTCPSGNASECPDSCSTKSCVNNQCRYSGDLKCCNPNYVPCGWSCSGETNSLPAPVITINPLGQSDNDKYDIQAGKVIPTIYHWTNKCGQDCYELKSVIIGPDSANLHGPVGDPWSCTDWAEGSVCSSDNQDNNRGAYTPDNNWEYQGGRICARSKIRWYVNCKADCSCCGHCDGVDVRSSCEPASLPDNAKSTVTCVCSSINAPATNAPICDIAHSQIGLSWSAVTGAEYYSLRVDDLSDGFDCGNPHDLCVDIGATGYTANIVLGHQYNWWVHGRTACGDFGPSADGANFQCNQPTPTPTSPFCNQSGREINGSCFGPNHAPNFYTWKNGKTDVFYFAAGDNQWLAPTKAASGWVGATPGAAPQVASWQLSPYSGFNTDDYYWSVKYGSNETPPDCLETSLTTPTPISFQVDKTAPTPPVTCYPVYDGESDNLSFRWEASHDTGCLNNQGRATKYWLQAYKYNPASNPTPTWLINNGEWQVEDPKNPEWLGYDYYYSCDNLGDWVYKLNVRQAKDKYAVWNGSNPDLNSDNESAENNLYCSFTCPTPTAGPTPTPGACNRAGTDINGSCFGPKLAPNLYTWQTGKTDIVDFIVDNQSNFQSPWVAESGWLLPTPDAPPVFAWTMSPYSNIPSPTAADYYWTVKYGSNVTPPDCLVATLITPAPTFGVDKAAPTAPVIPQATYYPASNSFEFAWPPPVDYGCLACDFNPATYAGYARTYFFQSWWYNPDNPTPTWGAPGPWSVNNGEWLIESCSDPKFPGSGYTISCDGKNGMAFALDIRQAKDRYSVWDGGTPDLDSDNESYPDQLTPGVFTCPTFTPTPTPTSTPTPTPGPWYKFKDASFNKINNLENPIPDPVNPFDASGDDPGHRLLIDNSSNSDPGIVIAQGTINLNSAPASGKNWWVANYSFLPASVDRFIDYVRARKQHTQITDLNQITTSGIYILNPSSEVIIDQSNDDYLINNAPVLLVVLNDKSVTFDGDADNKFNPTKKSIAVLSTNNIRIKSSVEEMNGIFISSNNVNFSYDTVPSDIPLKISGTTISVSFQNPNTKRERADLTRPGVFIIFDPKQYLDLLPYLSIGKYDWRLLQ